MRPRITAALVTGGIILAAGGAGLIASAPASAHTPELSCSGSTIIVDLTNYPAGSTVGGAIDGVDLGSTTFGPDRFHYEQPIDTATEHTYAITVAGSDGQGDHTWTGTTSELCGVPITPPVTQTPTPTPTPTDTPTPTPDVVAPLVQDFRTCAGAAFVLDNSGSTVAIRYTVAGKPFDVPAGAVVHTDADGYLFPNDIGVYTITTYPGDKSWTFAPASDCASVPPTDEPTTPPTGEPTTPAPSDGPTSEPTPTDTPSTEPTPTDGTTPPVSSPTEPSATTPASTTPSTSTPTPSRSATAVPVVDNTSTPDTLAYTGADRAGLVGGGVAAVGLLALGAFLLHRRHAARVRAINGSDER